MATTITTWTSRIDKWQHARDGSPDSTENPPNRKSRKNDSGGLCEKWKKLLKKK